jgi:dCTP deaminase
MILSDFDIKNMIKGKRLVIRPLAKDTIRQNGVDLRLANEIAHHNEPDVDFVMDPMSGDHVAKAYSIQKKADNLLMMPREQVLLSTSEYISVPRDVAGFVELRSTWARHGLSMPPTIIDAGFKGTVTLEVVNNAPYKILLRPGQRFAHVVFIKTNSEVSNKYNGFYNNQKGIKVPKTIK